MAVASARNPVQSSWVFAASQALAVLVPIVWAVTKFVIAIAIVGALAAAALYFLFTERDKSERDPS